MLLAPPLLFDVSCEDVEPEVLGLLLELDPELMPELPLLLPVLPEVPLEDDVPPEALDLWPAFHSSRLILPSWSLSSLSNSAELPLEELPLEELPPAALGDEDELGDEDDELGEEDDELPPAALGEEDDELPLVPLLDEAPLLCDMDGDDDWLLFDFASSA